jgi:hypothetical protein
LIEYEAAGGMRALRRIFEQRLTAQQAIDQLKQAGLLGRGGAAFPAWIKWESALKAPNTPKYFVVNADESEPGTFKDRVLLEGDPCRIIEGAIIGAYTIGAQQAYIYIRGEYPRAIECLRQAIAECTSAGYLGQNIPALGSISISKSGRAPARTFAAKRLRCSNRSKASAFYASSPPSPPSMAVRQADGDQQRRDAGEDRHFTARRPSALGTENRLA